MEKESRIEGMQRHVVELIQQSYHRGYKDGYNYGKEDIPRLEKEFSKGYESGLDDAWKAARRIRQMMVVEWDKIFGCNDPIDDFTAKEAISRLQDYDEEQKVDDELSDFCFSMPNCSVCPIRACFSHCGNGFDICVSEGEVNEAAHKIVDAYKSFHKYEEAYKEGGKSDVS